jgi:glycosyltransferase involved in cell wall biosynthesis
MKLFHICLNMLGSSNWIGGKNYIQNLAKAISILPSDESDKIEVSITASALNIKNIVGIEDIVDNIFTSGLGNRVALEVMNHLPGKMFKLIGRKFNTRNIDFFYPETTGMRLPYNYASWIPDFQHRYMPELFSQTEINKRNKMYEKIANNAPLIVLSSRMALNDFNNFYPQAAKRSTILNFYSYIDEKWFTADPKKVQKRYDLPDDFFIVCNQFWKHKDHDVIIKALNLMKRRGAEPYIVCTGQTLDVRFPDYFRELKIRINQLGLEKHFIILGLIPRFDQVQLIRRSLAVLQPSLFEGWSTVVEDARSLGKEILMSDFPVHIEQNPPYAKYFKCGDYESLSELMLDSIYNLSSGPDKEIEQKTRVENNSRFLDYGRNFLKIAYMKN